MKKNLIIASIFLLICSSIAFTLGPQLTEHESATSRYRSSIDQTFYTNVDTSSGILYYGLSSSTVTPASAELKISSNPNFISQGSKVLTNSDTFKSFHADGLSPDTSYTLYTLLVDDGAYESEVFSKNIESINYITNAFYDANKVSDPNDDTIRVQFHEDFAYSPGYTDFNFHVGYFNERDYEVLAINPPSIGELSPITELANSSFSNIVNIDSKTIELTVDANSLSLYNTESSWGPPNNPTFTRIIVNDTNSSATFGMDGGLYFMPMTYEIITTETYPKLNGFSYQNNSGIASDTMTLSFDKFIFESISNDDIIISFDDRSDGTYKLADITFTSSDFTKEITNGNDILIKFTSSGVDKIKLLESNTIVRVKINDNISNGLYIDPIENNKTLTMPGQNSSLKEIRLNDKLIEGFSPSQYSYYLQLSSKDYDQIVVNQLESLWATTLDPYASINLSNPSTAIYDINVTSQDTNETSMYSLDLSKLETRLDDIKVNDNTISGFSPDIYEYTFNVDSTFKVNRVSANAIDQMTQYTIEYSGYQPGTYVVSIIASQYGKSNVYKLNFISESQASSSNTSTTSNTVTEPSEIVKSSKQLAANLLYGIDRFIVDNKDINNSIEIEKLLVRLKDLTLTINTQEDALNASNNLITLSNTLSKELLTSTSSNPNLVKLLEEVSKSLASIISKFDNYEEKILKLNEVIGSFSNIKNSSYNSKIIDKSIDQILKDTNKSVNSISIKKPIISDENINTFEISKEDMDNVNKDSNKKIDELSKIANEYFKEENYINLKKEVEFIIDSSDDLTNISINKDAISSLKDSNIKTINIKVGDTTLALDTEMLDPTNNYELVIKNILPSSSLKSDEEVKTDINSLTNNKKFLDVSLLKNGRKLENLERPVELRLETSQFGFEEIDPTSETLSIYRYNNESGIWEAVGGIYDPITKTISVYRIHLSKYTVMKTKKTISSVDSSEVKSEVLNLLNKGIISDEKSNTEDNITREEFVSWLGKSYGLTSSNATAPFEDLDPSSESYKFIASVYEQGIISGKSKDKFGTDDFITYQEVAVALSNTLTTLDNKKINNNLTKKLSQIGGDMNVSDWAKDEIALIIELGIMDDSVALNANAYITREEAAIIFDKFYS